MQYPAGFKILERWAILAYLLRAKEPVSMPEILRLRGVPVVARGASPGGAKGKYASKASSTRQLMFRLCHDRLVAIEKGRLGLWSLCYVLTPEGQQVAADCEAYFAAVNALQASIVSTLGARGHVLEEVCPTLAGNVPGALAPIAPGESPAVPREPYVTATSTIRPVDDTPLIPRGKASKGGLPTVPHLRPAPAATESTASPASTRIFECPRCSAAITIKNLRQRLQRAKEFTCETCGLVLTDAAREFLDSIPVSG